MPAKDYFNSKKRALPDTPPGLFRRSFSLILAILLSLAILVSIGGYFFLHYEKDKMTRQVENELKAIVDLKVLEIGRWRSERLADARFITESDYFSAGVYQWMQSPDSGTRQIIVDRLRILMATNSYEDVRLVDTRGTVLISLEDDHLLSPATLTQLSDSLAQQEPSMVDLHFDLGGKPDLDVIAPVMFTINGAAAPIGAVILSIDPSQYFYPLLASWPLPNKSAESLIVRRQEDRVLFLSDLKYQPGSALSFSLPLSQTDSPAVMVVLGQAGAFVGKDYRGVDVISILAPIPDTPWYMVAKVDSAEAFSVVIFSSILILVLIFVVLSTLFISGLLFWQRRQRLHYQELYRLQSERAALVQHFEHLVKYANDMILMFDPNFRLIEVNDRAQEKYGYTRVEMTALNLADLVAEEAKIQNAADLKASLKNKANIHESIHLTKAGRNFPVEISARIIEVDGDDYLQWIVRDITERKVFEAELAANQNKIKHLNQVLRAIRNVNQLITREKDPPKMLQRASRELVETRGFEGAWLAILDDQGKIRNYCESGWKGQTLSELDSQDLLEWCACARKSLREKTLVTIPEPTADCRICHLSNRCTDLAVLIAPLNYAGKIFGFISVTLEKDRLSDEDSGLLHEIAEDIAFALYGLETEKQRFQFEQEARRYLAIAGVMILVLDQNGRIKLANKKCAEILGYAEDELIGRDWFNLALPDPEAVRRDFKRIIEGEIKQLEFHTNPVKTRQGSLRMIAWHNAVIEDTNGLVIGTLSSGEDITEHQKAEQNLRHSEEKFHALYENMAQGVIYQSRGGEVTSMNPAARHLLGLSLAQIQTPDLIDQNLKAIREDGSAYRALEFPTMLALRSGQAVKNAVMGIPLDHAFSYRWLVVDAVPQFIPDEPSPYQAFATLSDITALKSIAEMLQKRQEFLDSIIENTPSPLWISDPRGNIFRVNQALKDLLHVTDEEIIGKYNILLDSQVIAQGHKELVRSVFREGKTVHFTLDYFTAHEITLESHQNTHVFLDIVMSAIKDENGKVSNVICQEKDITQQRLSEIALHKSEENYRNSLENSPLGIRVFTIKGVTLFTNRALLDIYGFKDIEEFNNTPSIERYNQESYVVHLERRQKRIKGEYVDPDYTISIKRKKR